MADSRPQGFYNNVAAQLTELNINLRESSAAATRLASALNWLTGIGVTVALLGIVVAAIDAVHRWNIRV